MYIFNSSPTVRYCTFQNNLAYNSSGYAVGGALCVDGGSPTIENCDFSSNEAYGQYLVYENGEYVVYYDGGYGGAIYTYNTGASFYDCTIGTIQNTAYNNHSSDEIYTDGGNRPTYSNCGIRGGWLGDYMDWYPSVPIDGGGNYSL